LNQVERWSAKISRIVIARGVLTSVAGLTKTLMGYIHEYKTRFFRVSCGLRVAEVAA